MALFQYKKSAAGFQKASVSYAQDKHRGHGELGVPQREDFFIVWRKRRLKTEKSCKTSRFAIVFGLALNKETNFSLWPSAPFVPACRQAGSLCSSCPEPT
jgi:hypothetical protein